MTATPREFLLQKGFIKRIHVNQHMIKAGAPSPLTIQTSSGPLNAAEVAILGPSVLTYDYDNPLSCGARVWIETYEQVDIIK